MEPKHREFLMGILIITLLVVCMGMPVFGDTEQITNIVSNQGTANYWGTGDVVYNEVSWNGGPFSWIGCNNGIVTGYQTVLKFSLVDFNADALTATLSVYRYDCAPYTAGAQYFQLQHITQATSGPIVRADVTGLTGENVGTPLDAWTTAQPMTWDVASYINADLANGFAYSSFRLIDVDAQGNWLQTANTWAGICTKALAPGNLTFSPNISAEINEPAPLVLHDANGLHTIIYDMSGGESSTTGYATDTLKSAIIAATGHTPQTDPMEILPPSVMEGYTNQYGGTPYVYTNSYLVVGNNNSISCSYRSILKFPLQNLTRDIENAALKLWRVNGGGVSTGSSGYLGVYVRLQHATSDIGGAVTQTDATSSNFENVGTTVLVTTTNDRLFSWDVNDYINADRTAGFNYSSFRLIAVDSSGNPIADSSAWGDYGAYFASQEYDSVDCSRLNTSGVSPAINDIPIQIGVSEQFKWGIDNDSPQAYEIRRTYADTIDLIGNSESAALWAVLDFCEKMLNVSWPVADDVNIIEGAIGTNITIDSNCSDCNVYTPGFDRRGWIFGQNTDGYGYENYSVNWMSHNKQNATIIAYPYLADANDSLNPKDDLLERGVDADTTMHSFWWLVPVSLFADHNEYFPLIDGVRVPSTGGIGPQLCISNATVQQMMINQALAAFASHPELSTFGIVPNDGAGQWCECASCVAMDGNQAGTGVYSNRLIELVNAIAAATRYQYPNKYISTLAYADYCAAPTIDVNDNVSITLCVGNNLMKKLTDANDSQNAVVMSQLNAWRAKAKNICFWEYYWFSGSQFCPSPFTRVMCEEIHDLASYGVKGFEVQTHSSMWHNMGLLNYAFAQMTWDPSLTFDDILPDYCGKMYGPAASDMQSYHSFYESTVRANVPVLLYGGYGAGEQHIPAAFTDANITTLAGYLDSAHDIVEANGTLAQKNAVNYEHDEFEQFRRLKVDPVSISNIGSNVILNPGAESGSTSWNTHSWCPDYSFSIDSLVKHSGSNSLKIQCTGNPCESPVESARWYQLSATVVEGEGYGVSFWVNTSGDGFGSVVIISGTSLAEIHFDSTDGQWVKIIYPEIIATAGTLDIYLQSNGPGSVYFDDIFIAALPVPTIVSTPSPVASATKVSITPTLSWTAGSNTTSHDVYFGTSLSDVNTATHLSGVYRGNQTGTTYAPGTLITDTTYYWRIDEVGYGNTITGTIWSFTTTPPVPMFVAAGVVTSGTGTIIPALPSGIATNDILLLFLETSNQAITINNSNGGTWTAVTSSPQGTGTAAGTTGARLTAFWSRYNGTQGAPTTSDSGNHQAGRIIAIRGAVASGNPWDVTAGGVEAASDTSGSIPGTTTTVANTLVVTAIAAALPDSTSTTNFLAWTNANLTSITECIDNAQSAGNGGAIGIATGIKAIAGSYGNTTVTLATSAYKGMMSIAIKP